MRKFGSAKLRKNNIWTFLCWAWECETVSVSVMHITCSLHVLEHKQATRIAFENYSSKMENAQDDPVVGKTVKIEEERESK